MRKIRQTAMGAVAIVKATGEIPGDECCATSNSNSWLLACLCAAWCSACGEYRNTFDALARERQGSARFIWVDIEDNEQALGSIDVVDFPTLLIAHGDNIVFFGPVTPNLQTARQLLLRAQRGQLDMRYDPGLAGLAARISGLG